MNICEIEDDDLKELSQIFGTLFQNEFQYMDNFRTVSDDDKNLIQVTNFNRHLTIRVNFEDSLLFSDVINVLNQLYPLDFNCYQHVLNLTNELYKKRSFFESPLKSPFKSNTWEQFLPKIKNERITEDFSRKILANYTFNCNEKMKLEHKLAFIKLKYPSGVIGFVPVVQFYFKTSRIHHVSFTVSLLAEHPFIFYKNKSGFHYVILNNLPLAMFEMNIAIMTNIYNDLFETIDMNNISFEKFQEFSDEKIADLLTVFNMVNI